VNEAHALQAESLDIEVRRLTKLGEFYQRSAHERLPASERYLREVVGTYPDTPSADRAHSLLERAEGKMASRAARDERRAADMAPSEAVSGEPTLDPETGEPVELPPVEAGTTPEAGAPDTAKPATDASRKSGKWLLPLFDGGDE
jgi:hypothetical protein